MDFFSSSTFSLKSLLDFSPLKPEVNRHLRNIYALLAVGMLSSTLGVLFDMYVYQAGGLLTFFGASVAFMIATSRSDSYRNQGVTSSKLIAFLSFAFLKGLTLGELVHYAALFHASALTKALLGTVAIFGAFSLSATFVSRRDLFFVSAAVSSLLGLLSMVSIANIFFWSNSLMNIQLYGGLVAFLGYVVVDTQVAISRFNSGEKDVVSAAAQLYFDFIAVFIRILIILMNDRDDQKRKKRH